MDGNGHSTENVPDQLAEINELRRQLKESSRHLKEANNIITAIRDGEIDALLVSENKQDQVYILQGADYVYREIVEDMQEGYVTLGKDGVILFCNSNFAKMLRKQLDQVIGMSMYDLLSPADANIFRQSLAYQDSFKREFSFEAGDGVTVPVLASINFRVENEQLAYMIITDLTEQKRGEQRFMHRVFEQAGEVIIVCDMTGKIIRVNSMATKVFGPGLLQKMFDPALQLFRMSDGKPFSVQDSLQRGDSNNIEVRFSGNDGQNLIFLVSAGWLTGAVPGDHIGFLVTLSDITDRKQAEEALRSSQARYRAVMEQSFEGMALIDCKSREVVEVNRKFTEMLGYSLPVDAPLYAENIVVASKRYMDQLYNKTLMQQRVLPLESKLFRHKNGAEVPVERAGTVISIEGKDFLLGSMRDMTKERARQAELARDVEVARQVQLGLLPELPDSPNVTIRALYYPSHFVSGDSYHLEWLSEENLLRGFLVDVTGHGLATALQTTSVDVLLREAMTAKVPLLEQMRWINMRASKYFTEGSYAALLGFELDFSARELRYVGAGITMFIANGKKTTIPGMFVGMWDAPEFVKNTLPIQPGDTLHFLTDGFTDALTLPENIGLLSSDGKEFDADVAALKQLAESGRLKDDATGICLQIRELDRTHPEKMMNTPVTESVSDGSARSIHELRVHQIELEMRNEQLRLMQEELDSARNLYHDYYDFYHSAPVGFLTMDEKERIVEANVMLASMLGLERASLVGQPLPHFILPEDQDIYYLYRRQLASSHALRVCEVRLKRKGSDPFRVRIEMTAVRGDDNKNLFRAVISNITESKLAEER